MTRMKQNRRDKQNLIEILKTIPMVDNDIAKALSRYWRNDIDTFKEFAENASDVGDEQVGCFYYYNQAITELNEVVVSSISRSVCDWCCSHRHVWKEL